MTITRIERQRHNSERFSIFIDGDFAFGLSGVDVLYYKLEEGAALTHERYDFLINEVLFTKARESALNYLGYRARTRKELTDKLEYPAEVVDRVISMLEEYGYVDDYAFAKNYVEARIRVKGFGKMRLKRELWEKGVEENIIEEILSDTDYDEVSEAVSKLERKARSEPIEPHERRRYFDYLVRQGFSYDVIKQAFNEYESGV